MFENIQIKLRLLNSVTPTNPATFKAYTLKYNILRINNGISGKLFDNRSK